MGANAQTSVPAFTAGQVLTAAQVTQINTGIPVFASSTERDAAFGGTGEKTLAEGQYAFLEDTNQTLVYDGTGWVSTGGKILQVLQTVKTDVFSASASVGVAVAVTGLTVTITPSSTSSKVLVTVNLSNSYTVSDRQGVVITRGGSTVTGAIGDSAGSRQQVTAVGTDAGFTVGQGLASFTYLDSPASTSALTYGVSLLGTDNRTHYVNRSQDDTDANTIYRTASFITVMEVGA
jgi:hypothetical protein